MKLRYIAGPVGCWLLFMALVVIGTYVLDWSTDEPHTHFKFWVWMAFGSTALLLLGAGCSLLLDWAFNEPPSPGFVKRRDDAD